MNKVKPGKSYITKSAGVWYASRDIGEFPPTLSGRTRRFGAGVICCVAMQSNVSHRAMMVTIADNGFQGSHNWYAYIDVGDLAPIEEAAKHGLDAHFPRQ